MEKALDPSEYIYQGCWINWSRGSRILGSTLTLSTANSTLLTNLLALFVTMAAGQCWTILRFTLHQIRASFPERQSSLLHNKQQVVLRNATTAITTAQLLLSLRWASRKFVSEAQPSSIPLVAFAVFSAAFFLAAGVFSNTLANAGPYVLSRSPWCGFWNQTYLSVTQSGVDGALGSIEVLTLFQESVAKREHDVKLSVEYAQGCYLGQSTGSSNCDTFQTSAIEFSTVNTKDCPFMSEICRSDVDTVVFDTGLLDSHTDLGINAANRDRLSYRRVTKCTVLDGSKQTTGFVNQSTSMEGQPTLKIARANFGPSISWGKNETYSYSNFADFYTNFAGEWSMSYQLGSDWAYANASVQNQGYSTFTPIPELAKALADADFVLLYLGFTGSYVKPIDDPWFSAHQPFHLNTSVPLLKTTYARDSPISTLGCTEQHQLCTVEQCTPLLGFGQVQDYIEAKMNPNPVQNITLDRLMAAVGDASLGQITNILAYINDPVLAIDQRISESHTISLPLPNDQWKKEAEYWQVVSLAQLQRTIVEYGTGQIAAQPQYLIPASTDAEKWICQNLMIRSTVYQSFSILALSLIVLVGLAVILLSFTIEQVSTWLSRRLGRGDATSESWKDHDMLGEQLWRTKVLDSAHAGGESDEAEKENLPPSRRSRSGSPASSIDDTTKVLRRVSSQALSLEDSERLLISRAYDSWI